MTYPTKGDIPVVPAADLASPTSEINRRGPARVNGAYGDNNEGAGKRAGTIVFQDNGSNDLNLCVALGAAPTDGWLVYGRESTVTPA